MSFTEQQVRAEGHDDSHPEKLKGRYAFTLAEKCVHQLGVNTPGFDSKTLGILDSAGAETYSGASDGLMIFDGKGGVTIEQARATNIMNAANRLVQPIITPIPLGFGIGGELGFTCKGSYNVSKDGIIAVNPLTCTATLPQPNVFNASGFQSIFNMTGWLPQNSDHLLLTDIGKDVQPVTIFFNGGGAASQQRICTRSTSLVLIAPK